MFSTTHRGLSPLSRRRAIAGAAGGGMALAMAARVAAQGATPVEGGAHPFVGTWLLDTDVDDPANPPEIAVVTADGGYVSAVAGGDVANGVWEPTGENTANLTIHGFNVDEDGNFAGMFVVRAMVEVDASGNALTSPYTFELVDAGGTGTGQYGPVTAQGTRLRAEPMGEPIGSMDDLFAQFQGGGEPGATPGASPEAGSGGGELVELGLGEFFITSSMTEFMAGVPYTFHAMNSGTMVHEVIIEPAGGNDEPLEEDGRKSEMEDIEPGGTAELTWTFSEPGSYQFGCHIEGHYEEGMVLAFEVTG